LKALLLAAGLGTRLRPITDKLPKCLVPIHGKPLLGYWLDILLANGIERILINTHYLPEAVQAFVQSHPLRDRVSLVHEKVLLGTAGTVLKNRHWLEKEAFLLAHADNLTRFDVQAFIKAHGRRQPGVEMTMMTFETDMPQSCGIVEWDENNLVVGFHEKVSHPPSHQANAAVYIIEPSIIEFLVSLNKEIIDFSTEVLPHYILRMQIFRNTDYHRDIGTPESLRLAELEFVSAIE
jgi:mannose-1-phosphate guanylyltransferase